MERTEERDEAWNLLNEVERESAACSSCARVALEDGWVVGAGLSKAMVKRRCRDEEKDGGPGQLSTSSRFPNVLRDLFKTATVLSKGLVGDADQRRAFIEHFYTISSIPCTPLTETALPCSAHRAPSSWLPSYLVHHLSRGVSATDLTEGVEDPPAEKANWGTKLLESEGVMEGQLLASALARMTSHLVPTIL